MIFFLLISNCIAYGPLTYTEITEKLLGISEKCPFVKLTTAQEKYNIKYPDGCENCSHPIVTITNSTSKNAPQVYFSGCLHGDERLGPVVLTELADYLCSEYDTNPWIKRLVDTRLIILTPMTNAVGYYHNTREEKSHDPNRDFPYNNPSKCFETLASQVIASIFEEHLIRIGITFHGGESSVTYPWGAYNHMQNSHSTEPPDLNAFLKLTEAIVSYSEANVRTGTMNDIVYPVNGGLEDWAYAGGWDNSAVSSKCSDLHFNNLQGLRQVLFLVETDYNKSPPLKKYGNKEDVTVGGGLVPQYIRMSLSVIDLAEPYILHNVMQGKNGVVLEWEVWGCVDVVETKVFYSESGDFENWMDWNCTSPQSGGGRWGNYSKFIEVFEVSKINAVVVAVVDQWTNQTHPDPEYSPQTHIVRARTSANYSVSHNSFTIIGNNFTKSEPLRIYHPPIRTLHAILPSCQVKIAVYHEYIEAESTCNGNLFISEYGDLRYLEAFSPLLISLCGLDQKLENKTYYNCTDAESATGLLISTDINGNDSVVIQSQADFLPENGGICITQSTEITFKMIKEDIVLVNINSKKNETTIKIDDKVLKLTGVQGKAAGFWQINSKILGKKISVYDEKCTIGVAKNTNFSLEYTNISIPLWLGITIVVFKITAVSIFLIIKCKRKPKLATVAEIELV